MPSIPGTKSTPIGRTATTRAGSVTGLPPALSVTWLTPRHPRVLPPIVLMVTRSGVHCPHRQANTMLSVHPVSTSTSQRRPLTSIATTGSAPFTIRETALALTHRSLGRFPRGTRRPSGPLDRRSSSDDPAGVWHRQSAGRVSRRPGVAAPPPPLLQRNDRHSIQPEREPQRSPG